MRDLAALFAVLLGIYRQRFRSHARGRRRGPSGHRHFWFDGSGGHSSCDGTIHLDSRSRLLQSMFSAAMSGGPPLHDANFGGFRVRRRDAT